jgi:flagellar assembly protein FliH
MGETVNIALDVPIGQVAVHGQATAQEKAQLAEDIVEQVKVEYRQKLSVARAEAEQQIAQARQQASQAMQAAASAADQLAEMQETLTVQMQQQAVELALEIARRVLCQVIDAKAYDIDPIIRSALEQLPPRIGVVIHLNPQDMDASQLATRPDDSGRVRFQADRSVPPAGCLIESIDGTVEADAQASLNFIERAFKDEEGDA